MPHCGSGRTNFWGLSVYGREPSFPNPTANLVSTKRENNTVLCAFSALFVLPLFWAALFVFLQFHFSREVHHEKLTGKHR